MEELDETPTLINCGDTTYLARSKKLLVELLCQDGDLDFSNIDHDLISELYQLGEWWRKSRRELPGVARLLESVRNGSVGYILHWWDQGFYLERGERAQDMKPVVRTAGRQPAGSGAKETPLTGRYDHPEDVFTDISIYDREYDIARLPEKLLENVSIVERDILQTIAYGASRVGETLNFVAVNVETGNSTRQVSEADAEREDVIIVFCPRAILSLPGIELPAPRADCEDVMCGEVTMSIMALAHLTLTFPDRIARASCVFWSHDLSEVTVDDLRSLSFGTHKKRFSVPKSRTPIFMFGSKAAISRFKAMASSR